MFKPINNILCRVKVLSSEAANKGKEIGTSEKTETAT